MNPRAYLAIEGAITRRLWSAWRPYAADLFQKVSVAVEDKQYERAYALARELDLTPIAETNREWIKYHLLNAALFGARMAHPKGPLFVSAGKYETTLNRVVDLLIQGVEYGATVQVYDRLMNLVLTAEHTARSKVEKKDRYLQGYTSFKNTGDDALQMQSSLHSSRLAVWGFTAEANATGVDTYQIQAVLDGRTCDFCTYIDGQEFNVADARSRVTQALSAADPQALKEIQPWPDQSSAGMADIMGLSNQELANRGYSIPPFHPNDRCICALVDSQPPTTAVAPTGYDQLPSQVSTADTFAELGTDFSAEQLDYWNQNVGVSPVQVLSLITGEDPSAVLADQSGGLSIDGNGYVDFHQEGDLIGNGSNVEVSQSYDPVGKELNINYVDVNGGTPDAAAGYTLDTIDNSISTAGAIGAAAVILSVTGGDALYASAVQGFVPDSAADWFDLSNDVMADLGAGADLGGVLDQLQPYQQQAVLDILRSSDEFALLALVALPYTVFGLPIGQVLLHGRGMTMRFDLLDDWQRAVYLDADAVEPEVA